MAARMSSPTSPAGRSRRTPAGCCCARRPSLIDGAKHSRPILMLLVRRLRQEWPDVWIIFRADSGCCRWTLLRWCDRHDVGICVDRICASGGAEGNRVGQGSGDDDSHQAAQDRRPGSHLGSAHLPQSRQQSSAAITLPASRASADPRCRDSIGCDLTPQKPGLLSGGKGVVCAAWRIRPRITPNGRRRADDHPIAARYEISGLAVFNPVRPTPAGKTC